MKKKDKNTGKKNILKGIYIFKLETENDENILIFDKKITY